MEHREDHADRHEPNGPDDLTVAVEKIVAAGILEYELMLGGM